jgi:S1-C subfamily serine protease
VFTRLQAFINTTPFPRVFEGVEPLSPGPVNMPDDPAIRAAVHAAGVSTVRVEGFGCGGVQTGSGFVVGPGMVVTNAHVVAGIRSPQVDDTNGRTRNATPVLFDPSLDLAVLRTGPLNGPPLALLRSDVHHGAGGAVLGYPGGAAQLNARPGAVLREFAAVGRDIYGRSLTRRNVYQLQATIRQGNSGGPFVRKDGAVLGVVFAASTSDPNVGYALTSGEVVSRVDDARGRTSPVGTGSCAA